MGFDFFSEAWQIYNEGASPTGEAEERPVCYLGHVDCYDMHYAERRADEADWEAEREEELGGGR